MSSYIVSKQMGWINPGVLVVDNGINDRVQIIRSVMMNLYANPISRKTAGYEQCCDCCEKRMNTDGMFHIGMWVWSGHRFMNSILADV